MGLIEQEIAELKELRGQIVDGKTSLKQAATEIAVFNQVAKREQLLYNILQLTMKHGAKVQKYVKSSNLIGDGTAVETTGTEVIVCPVRGNICITREDCLDFSGDSKHLSDCESCPNFSISRKQLLV